MIWRHFEKSWNFVKKTQFHTKCWRAKIHENPWIFMIFQNAFISSNNVIQWICKCVRSSEKLLEASKPIFKLFWRKNRYLKHILKNAKNCKKSHFWQKFKLFQNSHMASISWYMIWNETLRCPRHVLNRYSMSTMILDGF